MEPFKRADRRRRAAGPRVNVDTDQIIPARYLKRIERTGWGEVLFYDWRYNADGTPNPEFVLNRRGYEGAQVLVAGRNFGSGSSREHAVWAVHQYGIRGGDRAQVRGHLPQELLRERPPAGDAAGGAGGRS